MKKLHEASHAVNDYAHSNGGERSVLCSNKGGIRSPSLDFLDTSAASVTEEQVLEYLAKIISDIYLKKVYGDKKGSDLLSGLDKRTG
jgi:hypothetical protein